MQGRFGEREAGVRRGHKNAARVGVCAAAKRAGGQRKAQVAAVKAQTIKLVYRGVAYNVAK